MSNMGGAESKNKKVSSREKDSLMRGKVRQIQEEMNEMVCERRKESAAYERDMIVFAFKEAGWKQEKKKMREEVKKLRNMVEEKEERIRVIEDSNRKSSGGSGHENTDEDWEMVLGGSCAANLLVEQMKEERARRDETVEKWKQLYLAIKMELDDLIQRTHCGTGLYWRAEEEDIIVEELKRELKTKEEMIAGLNSKIASMENEQYKREREIDILRQSLRIMSCKKTIVQVSKKVSKNSQLVKKAC